MFLPSEWLAKDVLRYVAGDWDRYKKLSENRQLWERVRDEALARLDAMKQPFDLYKWEEATLSLYGTPDEGFVLVKGQTLTAEGDNDEADTYESDHVWVTVGQAPLVCIRHHVMYSANARVMLIAERYCVEVLGLMP